MDYFRFPFFDWRLFFLGSKLRKKVTLLKLFNTLWGKRGMKGKLVNLQVKSPPLLLHPHLIPCSRYRFWYKLARQFANIIYTLARWDYTREKIQSHSSKYWKYRINKNNDFLLRGQKKKIEWTLTLKGGFKRMVGFLLSSHHSHLKDQIYLFFNSIWLKKRNQIFYNLFFKKIFSYTVIYLHISGMMSMNGVDTALP